MVAGGEVEQGLLLMGPELEAAAHAPVEVALEGLVCGEGSLGLIVRPFLGVKPHVRDELAERAWGERVCVLRGVATVRGGSGGLRKAPVGNGGSGGLRVRYVGCLLVCHDASFELRLCFAPNLTERGGRCRVQRLGPAKAAKMSDLEK